MIEVKIESINKEDLNTDVLFEIANEIFKGNPKEKQAKAIKETLEKAPTIEQMKEDLEMYRKIADNLVKKIKEEEHRRKKAENHLIEKKIRTINISDKILAGTVKEEYKTSPKRLTNQETLKYVRVGNKVICTITNEYGKFQGMATQHPEDVFDYEKGMTLARIRAMRSLYSKLESALVSQM